MICLLRFVTVIGEKHDEVYRTRLCIDVGVICTGYATRTPPPAGRHGHHCSRSMWCGNAHGKWHLRENSRPPCRQQVRSRSDLLNFDCASGRSASSSHARVLATLLRGSVGDRLHSAGNADRSLSLVMVVRTGGVALTGGRLSCTFSHTLSTTSHSAF
jgi:hypothetical protein